MTAKCIYGDEECPVCPQVKTMTDKLEEAVAAAVDEKLPFIEFNPYFSDSREGVVSDIAKAAIAAVRKYDEKERKEGV